MTINGAGFQSDATVSFNGTAATAVIHTSATQLKATVPLAATDGQITVGNPTDGLQATSVGAFNVI